MKQKRSFDITGIKGEAYSKGEALLYYLKHMQKTKLCKDKRHAYEL